MTNINLMNKEFVKVGDHSVSLDLSAEKINMAVVHQIVKATLASRRQGTACTKNKSQVRGGGAKPFKQKGTGRARQGSSRSPLMVGGGTAFGPTPRDYTQKLNKKMVRNGIQSVLADKFQAGKLIVVDELPATGKTKEMYGLLKDKNMVSALIIADSKENVALRAAKNLQYAKGIAVEGFSIYEAVKFENLIIEKAALDKLIARLG